MGLSVLPMIIDCMHSGPPGGPFFITILKPNSYFSGLMDCGLESNYAIKFEI